MNGLGQVEQLIGQLEKCWSRRDISMSNKRKVGWYVDIAILTRIQQIALSKGSTPSQLVEKYIKKGLATESEITISERINYLRGVLNIELNGLLGTYNVVVEGSSMEKLDVLGALVNRKSRKQSEINKNKQLVFSLYTILEDIKVVDEALYDDLVAVLRKYTNIRNIIKDCTLFEFGLK